MRKIKILGFMLLFACKVFCQSKEDEAQALYRRAESQYEDKQYLQSRQSLVAVIDMLGRPNPKVLYLLVRVSNDDINDDKRNRNLRHYQVLQSDIEKFFDIVNKDTYPHDKYLEIVNIKLNVLEAIASLEKKKILYDLLKIRETKFLKDTFNVLVKSFVEEYNRCAKTQSKIFNFNSKLGGRSNVTPYGLIYDTINHRIYVLGNDFPRNGKPLENYHYFNALKPISISNDFIRYKGYANGAGIDYLDPRYMGGSWKITQKFIFFYTDDERKDRDEKQIEPSDSKRSEPLKNEDDKTRDGVLYYYYQCGISLYNWMEGKHVDYCVSSTDKLIELKKLMDSTGFTDYYNNKFDDVKD